MVAKRLDCVRLSGAFRRTKTARTFNRPGTPPKAAVNRPQSRRFATTDDVRPLSNFENTP